MTKYFLAHRTCSCAWYSMDQHHRLKCLAAFDSKEDRDVFLDNISIADESKTDACFNHFLIQDTEDADGWTRLMYKKLDVECPEGTKDFWVLDYHSRVMQTEDVLVFVNKADAEKAIQELKLHAPGNSIKESDLDNLSPYGYSCLEGVSFIDGEVILSLFDIDEVWLYHVEAQTQQQEKRFKVRAVLGKEFFEALDKTYEKHKAVIESGKVTISRRWEIMKDLLLSTFNRSGAIIQCSFETPEEKTAYMQGLYERSGRNEIASGDKYPWIPEAVWLESERRFKFEYRSGLAPHVLTTMRQALLDRISSRLDDLKAFMDKFGIYFCTGQINANVENILGWLGKKARTPEEKQELLETFGLDDRFKVCDHCGAITGEGYYLAGEYACSDKCAIALYEKDGMNSGNFYEELEHADEDDSEVYWTVWNE